MQPRFSVAAALSAVALLVVAPLLVVEVSAGATGFSVSPVPASSAKVHFQSSDPVEVGSTPVIAVLVNDGVLDFRVTSAEASLEPTTVPAAGKSASRTGVVVAFEVGAKFGPLSSQPMLTRGGALRISVATRTKPAADLSGWLVLGLTSGWTTTSVRLSLVTASTTVATGLTTWKVTSAVQDVHGTGDAATKISLTKGTCADAGAVHAVLVSDDHTANVDVRCPSDGAADGLPLKITGLSEVGTYTGTLKVGSESITFTVTRTLQWFWPVVAILFGLLVAVFAQGVTDRGWARDEARWIKDLDSDAAAADASFAANTAGKAWHAYTISAAVEAEQARLTKDRQRILTARGPVRRFLPWPTNFMADDRAKLRAGTKAADKAIADWTGMPEKFASLDASLAAATFDAVAPKLRRRGEALRAAQVSMPAMTDVRAVVAEVSAWPAAADLVAAIVVADERTKRIASAAGDLPWFDRRALAKAERHLRGLGAAVLDEEDATVIAALADRVTEVSAEVAELPPPPQISEELLDDGGIVRTETAEQADVFRLPRLLRQAVTAVRDRGESVAILLVVAVTAAVALWTGLTTLYQGKAWGTCTDFISAVAWGFATSALLAPVLTTLRRWGTRVADPDEPATS